MKKYLIDLTPTIKWEEDKVLILDQTKLPLEEVYIETRNYQRVITAIKTLSVRGAPAIGCAGAYACALVGLDIVEHDEEKFLDKVTEQWEEIANSRPTAVNLRWAVERMRRKLLDYLWVVKFNLGETQQYIIECAKEIQEDDINRCDFLCNHGSNLFPSKAKVMTICNTGGLATGGIGTALGCIQYAHAKGREVEVFVPETRPLLQGARLNTWELDRSGIPYTLITDSMAGSMMRDKNIDLIIVGADRIASNGDTANKIGTYNLAVLAKHHNIPFYVAAPDSTVDYDIKGGDDIPIEYRDVSEVSSFRNTLVTETKQISNPAFDVTPFELIKGIITEKGVWE